MLLKVFSVRDMKAEAFLQPYFSPTQGAALRAFGDACSKSDSPFYMHPNDYVLYDIGIYNDENGLLTACNPVHMLCCASDFVEKRVPIASQDSILGPKVLSEVSNHGS